MSASVLGAAEPTEDVALYVRNAAPNDLWIVVATGTEYTDATGFPGDGYIGAGCYAMPPGSRLVVVDRNPAEPSPQIVQIIYARDAKTSAPERYIDMDPAGASAIGGGIPTWWAGERPC